MKQAFLELGFLYHTPMEVHFKGAGTSSWGMILPNPRPLIDGWGGSRITIKEILLSLGGRIYYRGFLDDLFHVG